jgi:phosphohistidine phosphatase
MAQNGLIPHRALCSGAKRAVQTWTLVSEALPAVPTEIREDFYHASPWTLLNAIQALPQELESVILVGHNPTMEDLAMALAGQGDQDALREMAIKYPTGALAILDFSAPTWDEVREGTGHLRAFIRPRTLK